MTPKQSARLKRICQNLVRIESGLPARSTALNWSDFDRLLDNGLVKHTGNLRCVLSNAGRLLGTVRQ